MFKVNSKEKKARKDGKTGREGGRKGEKERGKKEGLKEDWDLFFTLTKVKTEAHLFLTIQSTNIDVVPLGTS